MSLLLVYDNSSLPEPFSIEFVRFTSFYRKWPPVKDSFGISLGASFILRFSSFMTGVSSETIFRSLTASLNAARF